MASTLRFSVEVAADQATHALNVLSTSFNQAGINAKQSLLGIGSGSKAAGEASKGFEGKLRSLKGEMASGDRTINFFARSLNNIVPEASAAGQGLRLLADGLIGGLGVGFALQGVMAILTLFGDSLKESNRLAEESAKAARDLAAMWDEVGTSFERNLAKIGDPKKNWQAAQVESATAATDKAIEDQEKKLRDVNARLNQALGDRENVGLFDNGAEARVVAALQEKQAITETLAELQELRVQQQAVAAERAEGAAAQLTDQSTAITFYQESRKSEAQLLELARQRAASLREIAEFQERFVYGLQQEAVAIANRNAKAARDDAERGNKGLRFDGFFAGGGGFQPGDGVLARGKAEIAAEEAAKEKAAAAQALAADIANSWIAALDQMLGQTKISAQSIVKVFAQLAAQMMAQAGFAWAGPIGGLIGLAANFLPSAAGGWGNVPNDTLAQIHKREMVLPEAESDVIRSLARNGGGPAPVQVTINAIDGPSVRDWIVRNGTDFSAGVRELGRQGR